MGNNKSKKKDENNEIEQLLVETYKNTDLEFSFKEILCFKLRIHDAENYFRTKFDFFFYFNNYLFKERLGIIYDNFNNKIENFSAFKQKETLSILIDFDDESENIEKGSKMEFDSLFAVIFEKLEISTILFFDMTNVNIEYIMEFFNQLVDSVDLYKYNRKFDCLYFLLPNTDFFIKNDCALIYVTNKIINSKKQNSNEEVNDIINEYSYGLFNQIDKNKLLNARYSKIEANDYIEYFIERSKPSLTKVFLNFNFFTEEESLILNNEEQFKLLECLIEFCPVNIIIINEVILNNFKVLKVFIKKILVLLDNSKLQENVLVLKMILSTKYKSEINITKLQKFIKNYIMNNSYDKLFQKKIKFVIEIYENTQINNNTTSRSSYEHNSSQIIEYIQDYQKLLFCWILNSDKFKFDFNLFFGVLLKLKTFEKLNNTKIIQNIKQYICANFHSKYSKETKNITSDELVF